MYSPFTVRVGFSLDKSEDRGSNQEGRRHWSPGSRSSANLNIRVFCTYYHAAGGGLVERIYGLHHVAVGTAPTLVQRIHRTDITAATENFQTVSFPFHESLESFVQGSLGTTSA